MNKLRVFECYGVYISVVFSRNLDREPAWRFVIESVESELYKSKMFGHYDECEKEAIKKAVDYI